MNDIENLDVDMIVSTAKEGEHLKATKKGSVSLKSVVGVNKMKRLKLYNFFFYSWATGKSDIRKKSRCSREGSPFF